MSKKVLRSRCLRSGSSGNSLLVEYGDSRLVVDCGLNGKSFALALSEAGLSHEDIKSLRGILITHEHSDHISGLGVLLRRYGIPVYLNRATLAAALPQLGKFDPNLIHIIYPQERFNCGDLQVCAFRTSHDAAESMGFRFDGDRASLGVCTDLGVMSEEVTQTLRGCRLLYMEANYNEEMLTMGPYPWPLKQRIRGARGHLSNLDSAAAIAELIESGVEDVVLCHLSQENNMPALALLEVSRELERRGARQDVDYRLSVARRFRISDSHETEAKW